MPPVLAALSVSGIERQHVIGRALHGAQDAAGLDRERLGQLLGEVRSRQQRHAGKIGPAPGQCESARILE
jgi:hypothetical protein